MAVWTTTRRATKEARLLTTFRNKFSVRQKRATRELSPVLCASGARGKRQGTWELEAHNLVLPCGFIGSQGRSVWIQWSCVFGDVVKRVLLTGMSGTGKSTVVAELAARGYKAVDADDPALSELVSVPVDEPTGLDRGKTGSGEKTASGCYPVTTRTSCFSVAAPESGDVLPAVRPHYPVDRARSSHRRAAGHEDDKCIRETSRGSLEGAEPSGNDRAVVEKSRRVRRRYVRPSRSGGRGDSQICGGTRIVGAISRQSLTITITTND